MAACQVGHVGWQVHTDRGECQLLVIWVACLCQSYLSLRRQALVGIGKENGSEIEMGGKEGVKYRL
jgi:hypothetical protein